MLVLEPGLSNSGTTDSVEDQDMTTGRTVCLSLLLAGTVVMAQEPTPVREVQELMRLRAKCDAQIAEKTKPVHPRLQRHGHVGRCHSQEARWHGGYDLLL